MEKTKSRKYGWGRLWINADMSQASSPIRYSTEGPGDLDYTVFQVADARHSWPKAFSLVNGWLKSQSRPTGLARGGEAMIDDGSMPF
jgi:hypothetical protein